MNEKNSNQPAINDNIPIGTKVLAYVPGDPLNSAYIGCITEIEPDGTYLVTCPCAGVVRTTSVEPY